MARSANNDEKRRIKKLIENSIWVIELEMEEIMGGLTQQHSLGDNGVIEAYIRMEAAVELFKSKLWPEGREVNNG